MYPSNSVCFQLFLQLNCTVGQRIKCRLSFQPLSFDSLLANGLARKREGDMAQGCTSHQQVELPKSWDTWDLFDTDL